MLIDADPPRRGPRPQRRSSRYWAPRTGCLAALDESLTSDVVLLRGPSGIGKTALLRQWAAELDLHPGHGVRLVDGERVDADELERVRAEFSDGPSSHVLLVDDFVERPGLTGDDLLALLHDDAALRLVVATRCATTLESPRAALDFDVHVIPPSHLLMTRDDVARVLVLNGVDATGVGIDALAQRTHGWPALIHLASARLRLEQMPLRTREEAEAVADDAITALAATMESRLPTEVTDDVRILSVAPHLTQGIVDALGVAAPTETDDPIRMLQEAGLVWPSSARSTLAEPIRERWLRAIEQGDPRRVLRARHQLLDHLAAGHDPLLAARLAADLRQHTALTRILRSASPEIWARDANAFRRFVQVLRALPPSPQTLEVLLALDPSTATSSDTPTLAATLLEKVPGSRGGIDVLALRVSLQRAAGRFALASETAGHLGEALRHSRSPSSEGACEGWYQAGMTSLAMGALRDARSELEHSARTAPPARRLRAHGVLALLDLIEGDVTAARAAVEACRADEWFRSPWGEAMRLADAWLLLETGDARGARSLLDGLTAAEGARELWPLAAAAHALSALLCGDPTDAAGLLRCWSTRGPSTPAPHFLSTHLLFARAKVLIALRRARKAASLFEGAFALAPATAPAIALSQLYAGRPHEAFVVSMKWGLHNEPSPRTALDNLVVSLVADARLNGYVSQIATAQRAEALSQRHDLWTPWSIVSPEDRPLVFDALSPRSKELIAERPSLFASSVSVPQLTRREQIVLARLTPTSTVSEIATALVVSPNTVKTQLRSLYRKLRVTDRVSAIRAAHAWGLVEDDAQM
jgi:LuxR family maltose regulon positive regulatory protein